MHTWNQARRWTDRLLALLAAGMTIPAAAATYVVDPSHPQAADDGPGTEAAPWKTLTRAASQAQAGDTILVLPGIYPGTVKPARSGVDGKPIIFRALRDGAAPEGAVVIEGGDPGVDLGGREYIHSEGFEIRKSAGESGAGVLMDKGEHLELVGNEIHHTKGSGVVIQVGEDCLIRDNYIHHVGGTGIHAGGLSYRVVRVQFLRNHIHDNGVEDGIQIGPGEDCLLAWNYIHDIWAPAPSHTDGIQLHSGNRNYRIIGNVCHRIRSEGFMIGAEGSKGGQNPPAPYYEGNIMSDGGGVSFIVSHGARNATFLHNTILWGHSQAMWIHNASPGATVLGNLFQSPDGGCVVTDDSKEGLKLDYNLTAGTA